MQKNVILIMLFILFFSNISNITFAKSDENDGLKEKISPFSINERNKIFTIKKIPENEFNEYVQDEIIVKFKDRTESQKVDEINLLFGASVVYKSNFSGFQLLKIPDNKSVLEMVELYRNDINIEYAEPNYINHLCLVPNDSYYSLQWDLHNLNEGGINMEPAWDIATGSGVIVAVIDTGITQGTDLARTCFVSGYDFVNDDNTPSDDNGHGTHVAGTIAQSTNNNLGVCGVAFDACLMPVKVANSLGQINNADLADGIYYSVNNGANILSLSLGGPSSTLLLQAVAYAYNHGVTVIAASGNNNGSISYPAAYDDYVIAVGATRYDKTRAWYSNFGSSLDLVAPGGDTSVDQNNDSNADGILQQTFEGSNWDYYLYQGTSMATPHVSGVAALIYSMGVTSPDNIKNILESSAIDLGTPGWDPYYGHGLINAYNALQLLAIANNDYYNVNEDTTLSISAPGVLINDTYANGNNLTAIKVTNPTHGTITNFNSNGTFVYVPTLNYFGLDSFTYKAYDGTIYSNIATVYINVTSVNDAPVVGDIPSQTRYEGSAFTSINLDSYISDVENTDAQISWTYEGNVDLNVSIVNRVATILVPNVDWYGTETITFKAIDQGGLWDNDSATFTVTGVNDPPVVRNIPNQTIAEGLTFATINLDDYVTDVDNTDAQISWTYFGYVKLTISIVNRSATISIPNVDWYGVETITFRATDPGNLYSQDIAKFTVTAVNDPPIVSNIPNQTIAEGSTFTVISLDNYVNDVDNTDAQMNWTYSGNSQLTVSIVNHIATIGIPNVNWYGIEMITFRATDPSGNYSQDAAIFSVTSVNDPPIANDDTKTVIEDSSDNQINVRTNDTDIEGDTLMISSVTQPIHGFSSTNGAFVYYTPTTNYNGPDSFTYTISDGHGGNDTAIVHIIVTGVNDPPVASFDFEPINPTIQETVFFNSTSYDVEGVISNYTWNFGDGNKSYKQKTTHIYTEYGLYPITLKVTDSDGVSDTIQKNILVSKNYPPYIPSDPSPSNDSTNVYENNNISWTDNDPNYDKVTYDVYFGITNPPDKVKSNQSSTTYDPGLMDFTTTYYWKIVAWDNHGAKNTSPTWHFTIRTNYPPTVRPDSYSTKEDTTLLVAIPGLLENDNDSYDDPNILTAVKVSSTTNGSVDLNSNESFSYIPKANYYGIDTFTYKIYDGYIYSNEETVTITINSVNDPPIFGTSSPKNGSSVNQLSLTWSIPINDIEGENFSWTIQCSNGQNSNSTGDEVNGTKSLIISGLTYSKSYTVWVNATDTIGSGLFARRWYTFTTKKNIVSGGGGGGYIPPVEEKVNTPPVADANGPYYEFVGNPVTFDGSASKDTDGNITNYTWILGDGTTGIGKITTHTYNKVGNYTVTLTVKDDDGKTNADTTYAVITEKPNYPPTANFSYLPLNPTFDDIIQFTDLSTDPDGTIISYYWNFSDETNSTNKNPDHKYSINGTYIVSLTIKDNNNATDTISKTIFVEESSDIYDIDDTTDKKTPGFELILVIIGIALVLFLKQRRIKL